MTTVNIDGDVFWHTVSTLDAGQSIQPGSYLHQQLRAAGRGQPQDTEAELDRLRGEITELRHGAGTASQTIVALVAQQDALLNVLRAIKNRRDTEIIESWRDIALDMSQLASEAIRAVEGK